MLVSMFSLLMIMSELFDIMYKAMKSWQTLKFSLLLLSTIFLIWFLCLFVLVIEDNSVPHLWH